MQTCRFVCGLLYHPTWNSDPQNRFVRLILPPLEGLFFCGARGGGGDIVMVAGAKRPGAAGRGGSGYLRISSPEVSPTPHAVWWCESPFVAYDASRMPQRRKSEGQEEAMVRQ